MKAWIKVIKNEKTVQSVTFELTDLSAHALVQKMRDALLPLDLPTPLVIKAKALHLNTFNTVRFTPDDFVEPVDFDLMSVELIRAKKNIL